MLTRETSIFTFRSTNSCLDFARAVKPSFVLVFDALAYVCKIRLEADWITQSLPVEFASGGLRYLGEQILPGVGFIVAIIETSCIAEENRVDN